MSYKLWVMSYELWVAQQIDYQLFNEKYPLSILHKKAVPLTNLSYLHIFYLLKIN